MKRSNRHTIRIIVLSLVGFSLTGFGQASIPFLKKQGTATQLIVDGKPFLILGGELHNSTSSNLDYMAPVLARFAAGHLNTALAAVCWDLIEPQEGKFDFSLVDGVINTARRNNLRLVLLWFGSWKNGVSTYPPLWVKTDLKRFPRAKDKEGMSLDILSTFSRAARDADARAFAALMRHVKQVDGDAHTVVMVQVENEVGVLSESRDRSAEASDAFKRPVPKELMDNLKKNKEALVPGFAKKWEPAASKLPAVGKMYSAPANPPMKSLWPGTMPATWARWRRRAKPNMGCRCL